MRDLEREVDELREQVRGLIEDVRALKAGREKPRVASLLGQDEETIRRVGEELASAARASDSAGILSYSGYYERSGPEGRGRALWVDERRTTDELFSQDDERVARLLSALGHRQRAAIIRELLGGPASATELVERLGMGTTGQVYHHLNALLAADLVTQIERGRYRLRGRRIPALMLLMAGVRDLLHDAPPIQVGAAEEPVEGEVD